VTAANHAGSNSQTSAPFTVIAPPSASISSPATGGTYAQGQSVATSFTCKEGSDSPGVASCDDSNATNTAAGGSGHLNTSGLGVHTYMVTAISKDGQTGVASIAYAVVAPMAVLITTGQAAVTSGKTKITLVARAAAPARRATGGCP